MDKQEYAKEIQGDFDKVHSLLKDVSLKFNNDIIFYNKIPEEELTSKIVNRRNEKVDLLFELRDAFYYRQDSILYHFNLLINTQSNSIQSFTHELDSTGINSILKASAYQQQFLFDDILFNTISLFDYFGNYVGFIFDGQHGKKMSWNSLYSNCKDKNSNSKTTIQKLYSSKVARLIISEHENWIDKLYDYRSRIIHKKIDEIDGSVSYSVPTKGQNLPKDDHEITILVPKEFAKDFKLNEEELSLIESLYKLLNKSSSSLLRMLETLENDIDEIK